MTRTMDSSPSDHSHSESDVEENDSEHDLDHVELGHRPWSMRGNDIDDDAAVRAGRDLPAVAAVRSARYRRPTYFRSRGGNVGVGGDGTRRRYGGMGSATRIRQVVEERYVRHDLGYGCYFADDIGEQGTDHRRAKELAAVGVSRIIANTEHLLSLLIPSSYSGPDCLETVNTNISRSPLLEIVVCDTNVLLHNMDLLEKAVAFSVVPNFVIPQTSLVECRAQQMVAYDRTVDLLRSVGGGSGSSSNIRRESTGESASSRSRRTRCGIFFPDPFHEATAEADTDHRNATTPKSATTINDTNDASIRRVAAFFGQQLSRTNVRVVLLTDDAASRRQAKEEQTQQGGAASYDAFSVRQYVQVLEQRFPGLLLSDHVAQLSVTTTTTSPAAEATDTADLPFFAEHVDAATLSRGLRDGQYYRGVYRFTWGSGVCSVHHPASITIRQGEERVIVSITSPTDANRAVDGDVVAIALKPLGEWLSPVGSQPNNNEATVDQGRDDERPSIASETAEPTISDLSNVPETMSVSMNGLDQNLRPTGCVVGIIRRGFRNQSGSIWKAKASSETTDLLTNIHSTRSPREVEREKIVTRFEREHEDGSTTCVFFPVDTKIPPVLIRTTQRDRIVAQRIVVALDAWPANSPYPLGHYVRTIGPVGNTDVETEVLLQEYDIPHEPFPAAVLACLPPTDYSIDADNSPGRVDLRHLPILSIDPPNCKDIDDALHCLLLPNGNYQVGVHIADVTHYVKSGNAMDVEAARRSTSTYLVNKRLDMLPSLLTTDLCSLKGNVDRYAFSVLFEVTRDADIIHVEFKKSLIHSIAALTYQQAQAMIDLPDDVTDKQALAVKGLAVLARKFRKRRIDAGALTLASPEVKFVLDSESLNPTDVQAYALLEANAVVEEFMLLANVTVAKKILRHYPTLSVLRRHPAPNRSMFRDLISKAQCRGFDIRIEDSKQLADSLDEAQDHSDPFVNKLLRMLSTRCMSPAQYFCSGEFRPTEWHHYGLAAPVYTHFTSPIRRYADVCVHRLLAAAIGVEPLPAQFSSKSHSHDLCDNMNRRHRAAQLAGRASVQLHTLVFFAGDNGGAQEVEAYVLDVDARVDKAPVMTVMVPRFGIEGKVKIPVEANDPGLVRLPEQHKLTYTPRATTNVLHDGSSGTISPPPLVSVQVFDPVRVRIWVRQTADDQRELVMDLVAPQFGTGPDAAVGEDDQTTPGDVARPVALDETSTPLVTQKKRPATAGAHVVRQPTTTNRSTKKGRKSR